jgi:hypothetical protein
MTYAYDLGNGHRLLVENDGDDTQATLSSGYKTRKPESRPKYLPAFRIHGYPLQVAGRFRTGCRGADSIERERSSDHSNLGL